MAEQLPSQPIQPGGYRGIGGGGLLSGGAPLFGGAASDIGILGYTPTIPATTVARGGFNIPLEQTMFEGANKYENYAQAYPDLMHHYLQNIPSDTRSLGDWAKSHWEHLGQAEGRLGPEAFPASRYLPSMPEAYDPRAGVTETTYSAGLPQPDVEGYKYEYPVYEWGGTENPEYTYAGHTTADIGEYPYYPYMPYGDGQAIRSRNDRILVGQRLVPGTSGSTSSTSDTTSDTTSEVNTWASYVTRNQDLEDAYAAYLSAQDSSIVDEWELHGIQYGVGGMNENYPGTPMSKEQFGHAHWLRYGRDEGRTP